MLGWICSCVALMLNTFCRRDCTNICQYLVHMCSSHTDNSTAHIKYAPCHNSVKSVSNDSLAQAPTCCPPPPAPTSWRPQSSPGEPATPSPPPPPCKIYLNCIPPKYPNNNTGCANFVSKVDRKTIYMYLSLQAGRVLEHMEKLRVVDLEQHPCDLAGEVRVLALKESVSNI